MTVNTMRLADGKASAYNSPPPMTIGEARWHVLHTRARQEKAVARALAAEGHRPSPPTVYRALEFLLQHALIHRVSSRNAFVGCSSPGDDHMAQIFLCDRCGVAIEQADPSLNRQILDKARDMRFVLHNQTVELTGLCPQCQEACDDDRRPDHLVDRRVLLPVSALPRPST